MASSLSIVKVDRQSLTALFVSENPSPSRAWHTINPSFVSQMHQSMKWNPREIFPAGYEIAVLERWSYGPRDRCNCGQLSMFPLPIAIEFAVDARHRKPCRINVDANAHGQWVRDAYTASYANINSIIRLYRVLFIHCPRDSFDAFS